MNGYDYLIQRNRLMIKLEEDLAALKDLAVPACERETTRLQAQFDIALRRLYGTVADEYPGERKKKARALSDPR